VASDKIALKAVVEPMMMRLKSTVTTTTSAMARTGTLWRGLIYIWHQCEEVAGIMDTQDLHERRTLEMEDLGHEQKPL